MMAEDASTRKTDSAAEEAPAATAETEEASVTKAETEEASATKAGTEEATATKAGTEEATATKAEPEKAAAPEAEQEPEPEPDPESCKAIAIGLDAFEESALEGEWDDTDFRYYLEPAGVLNGPLRCTRAPDSDPQRAGLLMTRAGWQAKKVFLSDGVNPETYELSFPKEFGYVKPLSHYIPETRKSAKYPWSKKY